MRGNRLLTAVLIAVCLFGTAEVAVRAFGPSLPQPLVWRDAMTQTKVAQMDTLKRTGGVDVVFAGTSQMLFGVNPALVARQSGVRSYNAGINAGTPELNERWLLDEVVPRLHPRLIVYGVAGPDLVDTSERWNAAFETYRDAPATRSGRFASIDRRLGRISALWRYRFELRDPSKVVDAVRDRLSSEAPARDASVGGLTPLGFSARLLQRGFRAPKFDRNLFTTDVLANYQVGPRQMRALGRILAGLKARGIDVVLVEMPVSAALVELYPNGRGDIDSFHAAIAKVAAPVGVPVLDLRTDFEDHAYFADYDHLNGPGALLLTTQLTNVLGSSLDGATERLQAAAGRPLITPDKLAAVPGLPPQPAPAAAPRPGIAPTPPTAPPAPIPTPPTTRLSVPGLPPTPPTTLPTRPPVVPTPTVPVGG